jgi:hypothetical protein
MSLFPAITDQQIETLRAAEPTAFRVRFEGFGEIAFRKPKRSELKRLQDAIKKGADTDFLVRACLLSPAIAQWDAAIEQEACGLPTTALDALCKSVGIAAEYDLGK